MVRATPTSVRASRAFVAAGLAAAVVALPACSRTSADEDGPITGPPPGSSGVGGAGTQNGRTGVELPPLPTTYRGFSYGTEGFIATEDKPQSKLWHADGSWWGLMTSPSDKRPHVYELMADHSWRDTGTVVDDRELSRGDALFADGRLYTVTQAPSSALRVNKLTYRPATRSYTADRGFPERIGSPVVESFTLDRDSRNRLWLTYEDSRGISVLHTLADETQWTAPFSPPGGDTRVAADDIPTLVAFDGKIGVMWSDQRDDVFRFAVHDDDAPDTQWTFETALAGRDLADDHLNVKVLGDRVYAAVKTSLADTSDEPGEPQILVLDRDPAGKWTSTVSSTNGDNMSRPVLLLDATHKELYLFATGPERGGAIHYKKTALDRIAFGPGRGSAFVKPAGLVNNATTTKSPVTSRTGMVVLASTGGSSPQYYHGELSLADPAGAVAPGR